MALRNESFDQITPEVNQGFCVGTYNNNSQKMLVVWMIEVASRNGARALLMKRAGF
jgi:hypothetical protein